MLVRQEMKVDDDDDDDDDVDDDDDDDPVRFTGAVFCMS